MKLITAELLKKIAPGCPEDRLETYSSILNEIFSEHLFNTPMRQACFFGQVLLESGEFKYMREIWNPAKVPEQVKYERNFDATWPPTTNDKRNRKAYNLGNTERGDGILFRGSGPLMCTGRGNILQASVYLYGDDRLIKNTDMLALPRVGFDLAAWFWLEGCRVRPSAKARAYLENKGYRIDSLNLHKLADAGELRSITLAVNGDDTNDHPTFFPRRVTYTNHAYTLLA